VIRPLLFAVALMSAESSRADSPPEVVDRLVRFAYSGCDFLRANMSESPQPPSSDASLAHHFGKVLRVKRKFGFDVFTLDVPAFRGWTVTFTSRAIEMSLPPRVRLTVADFERQLGHAKPADVDVSLNGDADATDEPEVLDFPVAKERPNCWLRVTAQRRSVTVFRFDD
jgi:hypothetical protein